MNTHMRAHHVTHKLGGITHITSQIGQITHFPREFHHFTSSQAYTYPYMKPQSLRERPKHIRGLQIQLIDLKSGLKQQQEGGEPLFLPFFDLKWLSDEEITTFEPL